MQRPKTQTSVSVMVILLLGALLLSLLAACGGSDDDEDEIVDATTPVEVTEPQETTPATPAATAEPVATEAPTEEPEPAPAALFLEVTSPEDETVISTEQIEVTGKTLPTAIVSVNGTLTKVNADGTFSYPMTLEVGPNDIQVVASTIGGDETGKVLVVVYIPE